jgi:hypothetical protein
MQLIRSQLNGLLAATSAASRSTPAGSRQKQVEQGRGKRRARPFPDWIAKCDEAAGKSKCGTADARLSPVLAPQR